MDSVFDGREILQLYQKNFAFLETLRQELTSEICKHDHTMLLCVDLSSGTMVRCSPTTVQQTFVPIATYGELYSQWGWNFDLIAEIDKCLRKLRIPKEKAWFWKDGDS